MEKTGLRAGLFCYGGQGLECGGPGHILVFMFRTLPLAAIAIAAATGAQASEPRFALPLDCTLGESCFIQNYVDTDPGPAARDFTCGGLTYDGHKGTDFALPSFAAMAAGVTVRAAAPGVVRATRDGMPDTGLDGTPAEVLEGKDCGNGVVIDHGGGWESQYCHLMEGSVSVRQGDRVATGAALGAVGYSGRTQAPHVHMSLRKDGAVVDPFSPEAGAACGLAANDGATLWAEPIAYVPGGLLALGFAAGVPDYADVKAGTAAAPRLAATGPGLVLWGYAFGGRAGDSMAFRITGPDGDVVHSSVITLDRAQAQFFRASGRRAPATGWPPGRYQGEVVLIRDGQALSRIEGEVVVD